MTSERVAEILSHAPDVRCFAVGSDDLARTNSERATRQLPKPKCKQAARNKYIRWKRQVDSIIEDARNAEFDDTIERLKSLPLGAIQLASDPAGADALIDKVADEIRQTPTTLIGVWEQFVSDSIVFIWLWTNCRRRRIALNVVLTGVPLVN